MRLGSTIPVALIAAAVLLAGGCVTGEPDDGDHDLPTSRLRIVESVTDGDTFRVRGGDRVRLVQLDAPEINERAECGGRAAAEALREQLPPGTRVRLIGDPDADLVDDFGRLLRYAFVDERNINLWLVARGHAAPYFYRGQRGRYASELEAAARRAHRDRLGVWGACPRARLRPTRNFDPGPAR